MQKNYNNILSRFHKILERHRRAYCQTDRFAISISRVNVLTRDKQELSYRKQIAYQLRTQHVEDGMVQ